MATPTPPAGSRELMHLRVWVDPTRPDARGHILGELAGLGAELVADGYATDAKVGREDARDRADVTVHQVVNGRPTPTAVARAIEDAGRNDGRRA